MTTASDATEKDMRTIRLMVTAGSLQITTSPFVAGRIHPMTARRLLKRGWVEYGEGGRSNVTFLVPTAAGREAAR